MYARHADSEIGQANEGQSQQTTAKNRGGTNRELLFGHRDDCEAAVEAGAEIALCAKWNWVQGLRPW